jgi:P2 family phage contractile tail tube protein
MNRLITLEAANLFCGSVPADITPSNHLTLAEIKLPAWDEQYVDHRAGGAPVAIEVDTIFARPECTFTLAGWSDQVAALIASWSEQENWFYAYCVLRDRMDGQAIEGVATMKGRLGRADPQNWRKGDLHHWAYSIRGMVYYQLKTDGEILYDWDFFNNTLVIGGEDRNADVNEILRTGATTTTVAPPQQG